MQQKSKTCILQIYWTALAYAHNLYIQHDITVKNKKQTWEMHKGASNAPPVPIKLIKPNVICIKSSNSECVPAWFRIRFAA